MSNITISALTLASSNKYPTTTGGIKLRIWYTGCAGSSFQDSLGNIVMLGSGDSNFFIEVPVVLAGTVLSIPSYVLPSTDDSSCLSAKATGQFYVNGAAREVLFSQYIITATLGASISFSQLFNYQPSAISGPTNSLYLTAPEVSALILASVGTLNDASTTVKGRTKLSAAPLSATNPIAVGNQDPLILALRGGSLESTGSIIIGADTDASGTDGITLKTRDITRFVLNNDGSFQSYTNAPWSIGESGSASSTTGPAMKLATGAVAARYNWRTRTAPFTNGPGGEVNYDDHVMLLGFNFANDGSREVSGLPTLGISLEHRFYVNGAFQSEFITPWLSPDGTITRRPYQWLARHTDGFVQHQFVGDMVWLNSSSSEQWLGLATSDKVLRLSSGVLLLIGTNNVSAIRQRNAADNADIELLRLDGSNVLQLGPGSGSPVNVDAVFSANTVTSGLFNFLGDTNTDIFNLADGYIQLRSNGTGKAYIAPDGIHAQDSLVFDNVADDIGVSSGLNGPRDIFALRTIDTGTNYKVAGTKVVGAQETGWTTGSGTPNKGAFAAYAGQTASVGYVQAEAQATDNAAKAASQRLLAVEQALRTHGLIN